MLVSCMLDASNIKVISRDIFDNFEQKTNIMYIKTLEYKNVKVF